MAVVHHGIEAQTQQAVSLPAEFALLPHQSGKRVFRLCALQ